MDEVTGMELDDELLLFPEDFCLRARIRHNWMCSSGAARPKRIILVFR